MDNSKHTKQCFAQKIEVKRYSILNAFMQTKCVLFSMFLFYKQCQSVITMKYKLHQNNCARIFMWEWNARFHDFRHRKECWGFASVFFLRIHSFRNVSSNKDIKNANHCYNNNYYSRQTNSPINVTSLIFYHIFVNIFLFPVHNQKLFMCVDISN